MYEHRSQRLLTPLEFAWRVLKHIIFAAIIIGLTLMSGVIGYHSLAGLPWIDALLNASMILGGMGPVDPLHTKAAKVFASIYALFSGLAFIGIIGVLLAPFLHRILHKLHIDK